MQSSDSSNGSTPGEFPPDLAESLTADVHEAFAKLHAVGAYAAVAMDGKIAWELPYGKADLASGAAVSRDTLFRIASITKTFTAAGIFQLRDAGALSLDDSVVKHLPELADAGEIGKHADEITLRRLLSHTAGLGRSWDVGRPFISDGNIPDREEAMASLRDAKLLKPPGKDFEYSNLGFSLLGEVITRVSGMDVEKYLVEKICKPLGLGVTAFEPVPGPHGNVAIGYERSHPTSDVIAVETLDLKFDTAAGGLYSNGVDLAKWAGFHLSDSHPEVLSAESRQEMRHPQHLAPDWNAGRCMNWGAGRVGEVMVFAHSGGIPGFSCRIALVPEQGFGVMVMLNTKDLEPPLVEQIVEKVSEGLAAAGSGDSTAKQAPEVHLATEPDPEMKKLTGIYLLDGAHTAWVEWWRGGLSIRPGEGEEADMRAKLAPTDSPEVFKVAGDVPFAGMPVRFQLSESGEVNGLIWDTVLFSRVGPIYE